MAPENVGLERPLPAFRAARPVHSPIRITPENNRKIRPSPDRENAFAEASGGGNATAGEPYLEIAETEGLANYCCRDPERPCDGHPCHNAPVKRLWPASAERARRIEEKGGFACDVGTGLTGRKTAILTPNTLLKNPPLDAGTGT